MSAIFNYSPSTDFLKSLTAGSLKQNLPKALRLYIILNFIYGEESYKHELDLEDGFTFVEWRNIFFIDADKYHNQEEKPQFHDSNCRCSQTLKNWLFSFYPQPKEQQQWCNCLKKEYNLKDDKLEELLTWGIIVNQKSINPQPDNKSTREPLDNSRLFAVSTKTLKNDLEALVKQGWLKKQKNSQRENVYFKVDTFPVISTIDDSQNQFELYDVINLDLATTLNVLAAPINDIQRFSLHVEYVIPQSSIEPTEELAIFLRKLWETDNFPVMQLKYDSAKYWCEPKLVVYPVYIFYYQRALYLSAYGQSPKSKDKSVITWYNYRMDRVRKWKALDWQSSLIPDQLLKLKHHQKLPTSEQIQIAFDQAWGLDFYEESSPLLLRFNRDFNDKYIQDTCRHQTFQLIETKEELERYIKTIATNKDEEKEMLARIEKYPDDAYYQAIYRVNDNNILMRIQAWNPNIEVLFPGHLRERIVKEIDKTWNMYK